MIALFVMLKSSYTTELIVIEIISSAGIFNMLTSKSNSDPAVTLSGALMLVIYIRPLLDSSIVTPAF